MDRRTFVRNASLVAGFGVFGNIQSLNAKPIGDSPTTSDVLGPFYRPGAPFRTDLNPADFRGIPLHLTGTIFEDDGKTPFKNCFVEIWQVDKHGAYDNLSQDYRYRGATKTGADGSYHFITTKPVSYIIDVSRTIYRPAHIHMRVAGAAGDSDLITQIYFKGDPHLSTDSYSSLPAAKKRILGIQKNATNEDVVNFDIVMSKEFLLDPAAFAKITGIYASDKDSKVEFYRYGDLLFMKYNGQISDGLYYRGSNSFDNSSDTKVRFELQQNGGAKVVVKALSKGLWSTWFEGTRYLRYQ